MRNALGLVVIGATAGCGLVEGLLAPEPREPLANPSYREARADAGLVEAGRHWEAGRLDEAAGELRRVVDRGLGDASTHVLLARTELLEGRLERAEDALDDARALAPEHPDVHALYGQLHELRGDWRQADRAYARASAARPDDVALVIARARVLQARGQADEAAEILEEELERHPTSPELLRAAGYALLSAGDVDEAVARLRRAQDLDGGADDLEAVVLAMSQAGRHDEIVALARRLEPGELSPQARYALGQSAMLAGHADVAVEAFQQYVAQAPADATAWKDLARAHFLRESYPACFEALGQVLRLSPRDADAIVLLGHVRSRVGQHEQALAAYQQAVEYGADAGKLSPLLMQAARENESALAQVQLAQVQEQIQRQGEELERTRGELARVREQAREAERQRVELLALAEAERLAREEAQARLEQAPPPAVGGPLALSPLAPGAAAAAPTSVTAGRAPGASSPRPGARSGDLGVLVPRLLPLEPLAPLERAPGAVPATTTAVQPIDTSG